MSYCSTLLILVVARSVATLWHSSSNDLSNPKMRIDVKLLEDKMALINNIMLCLELKVSSTSARTKRCCLNTKRRALRTKRQNSHCRRALRAKRPSTSARTKRCCLNTKRRALRTKRQNSHCRRALRAKRPSTSARTKRCCLSSLCLAIQGANGLIRPL